MAMRALAGVSVLKSTRDREELEQGSHLIGAKISKLHLQEDQVLFFSTDRGLVQWVVYGDCCSYSYFYELIGLYALQDATVSKLEVLFDGEPADKGEKDPENIDEFLQAYGMAVHTDKGLCKVIFRNASNGYYGGWAEEKLLENVGVGEAAIELDLSKNEYVVSEGVAR